MGQYTEDLASQPPNTWVRLFDDRGITPNISGQADIPEDLLAALRSRHNIYYLLKVAFGFGRAIAISDPIYVSANEEVVRLQNVYNMEVRVKDGVLEARFPLPDHSGRLGNWFAYKHN